MAPVMTVFGCYPWRKYGEGQTVTQEGHFTDTLVKEFTSEDFRLLYCNKL